MTWKRPTDPNGADHPSIGQRCPACQEEFAVGDYTTLVPIGPGSDPEKQRKARQQVAYTAVAIEAHWACVTGESIPPKPQGGINFTDVDERGR